MRPRDAGELEQQPRGARPLHEPVRAGADRIVARALVIVLDDLACHLEARRPRQHVVEARVGLRELDTQGVAINELQTLYR
jgi:hypothetical protein